MNLCSRALSIGFLAALSLSPIIFPVSANAQFYPNRVRPANIQWKQLESETFRVIYPSGSEQEALRTAEILSEHYPAVSQRLGAQLASFPVVLNPNNSLSNGFVSPLNFRSEIELNPIKGKFLNPRSGPWLETVIPHELVHAVHNEIISPGSITSQIGLFSKDIRRSLHSFVPLGLHEGIAVDYESHGIEEGVGRGNYSYFTQRLPQAYGERPWSAGQMFHISMETLPYDRHYVGGYAFMNWLRETYSQQAINESIKKQHAAPLFGYGLALKRVTGKWPGQLHSDFLTSIEASSAIQLENRAERIPLNAPFSLSGPQAHRPLWISEDQLVLYVESYNHPAGFFTYRMGDDKLGFLLEARIVEDYQYTLLSDEDFGGVAFHNGAQSSSSRLLFASYTPSLLYEGQWRSQLNEISIPNSLEKGGSRKKTSRPSLNEWDGHSLYAPVIYGRGLLAVKDHPLGHSPSLVRLEDETLEVWSGNGAQIIEVATKPSQNEFAIVAKVGKTQGIWFFDPGAMEAAASSSPASAGTPSTHSSPGVLPKGEQIQLTLSELFAKGPDVGFENGSIFDVQWHPEKDVVLFASDASGMFTLYELTRDRNGGQDELSRLRLSNGNVFEGSYSPSGTQIAAILQEGQDLIAFVTKNSAVQRESVPSELWRARGLGYTAETVELFDTEKGAEFTADEMGDEPFGVEKTILAAPSVTPLFTQPPTSPTLPPGWRETSLSSDISWMKPRMWFPFVEQLTDDVNEIGIQFSGTDVLSEKTYNALLTSSSDRVWGGLSFNYSGFWPGLRTSFESRPSIITYTLPDEERSERDFILRQRGGDIGIPLSWNLSPGTHRSSSFSINPSVGVKGLTFLPDDITEVALTEEQWVTDIGINSTLALGIHQRSRNPQPERGTYLYTQYNRSFGGSSFEFSDTEYVYRGSFNNRYGFRAGVMHYLPLVRSLNQSLLLQGEFIQQSAVPMYDLFEITNRLVDDEVGVESNDGVYFRARATLPVRSVDNGGLLVPLYLGSLYVAFYHQSFIPYDGGGLKTDDYTHAVGGGLRFKMKFGNIGFDFGIGASYNLSDKEGGVLIGSF